MNRRFRKLTPEDATMILNWRNDPFSVEMSFSKKTIDQQEHAKWLASSPIIHIYEQEGIPVGMVRLENEELSWIISPTYRKKGIGREMLSFFLTTFPRNYKARIRAENTASLKIAKRAGFVVKNQNEESVDLEITTATIHDLKMIDQIEQVRGANNVNWMDLLRISLRHAPEETKEVLRRIQSDDATISHLLKQLGS